MRARVQSSRVSRLGTLARACALGAALAGTAYAQDDKSGKEKEVKKPSLQLRVSPAISFSPARVVVSAELKGGADDQADLYCPNLEWEWGDGTRSEAQTDCEPFEAGKSEIKRRFTSTHMYTTAGSYRAQLRLKRGSKVLVGGHVNVQVKAGVRDNSEPF